MIPGRGRSKPGDSAMPQPDFIVQTPPLGDPQSPPPYKFDDVGLQMYSVLADASRLRAVCDRCLNSVIARAGGTSRVEPIAGISNGIVNIQLLRYPKIYSTAPGYENFGYTSQNELLISIPVVKRNALGIPVAVGLFAPFLWVDNAWSLITGRDVVGFAKTMGDFAVPGELWETDGCAVRTLGTSQASNGKIDKETLLSTGTVSMTPYMRPARARAVNPHDRNDKAPFGLLPDEEAIPLWPFGDIDRLYASNEFAAADPATLALMNAGAGMAVRSFALKQLRDASSPTRACYQAVIEGRSLVSGFTHGGLLPTTNITLSKFLFPNVIDQLGIAAQGDLISPLFGYWYRADFVLDDLVAEAEHCGGSSRVPAMPGCLPLLTTGVLTTLRFYQGMANAWLQALESCVPPPNKRP